MDDWLRSEEAESEGMKSRKKKKKDWDRSKKHRHVSTVLQDLLQKRNMEEPFRLYQARLAWNRICGDAGCRFSNPHEFRGHTLVVEVSDSVWCQELHFAKQNLLDNLEKEMPKGMAPKDLHFVIQHQGRRKPEWER